MATALSCKTTATEAGRRLELADIFRARGAEYRRSRFVSDAQRKVMRAVEICRTPALGGQLERCDCCGIQRAVYHSCRNRHCPKCQTLAKERWLEVQRARLLPVDYFHVVFTLPHELNPLAESQPRFLYDLLFRCATETLRVFGEDPKHLGGSLGITAVLHTWSQTLSRHVHLHCLVTGGALAPDGSTWQPARKGYLFPVRALSRVFRGKCLDRLTRAREQGLVTDAELPPAARRRLTRHDWVVYCKAPMAGPTQVLDYLARYTHRVALSNNRLIDHRDGRVSFRYRNRARGNRQGTMNLEVDEFIERFLLHVLPKRFVRIRHYGLHANRNGAKLDRARELLGQPPPESPQPEKPEDALQRLTGRDILRCPHCQRGQMVSVRPLRTGEVFHPLEPPDTS